MSGEGVRSQLMVTVRGPEEVQCVVSQRVGWLDVKEPSRGSLGRPAWDCVDGVLDQIAASPASSVTMSVALGELSDAWLDPPRRWHGRVRYFKVGLAGAARLGDWHDRWLERVERIRSVGTAVAVAYADWIWCGAPDPMDVVRWGARLGCGALLVDTFDKRRGDLTSLVQGCVLESIVAAARRRGMVVVLAGSITLAQLPRVLLWRPDVVAMRGGLCWGGRGGPLDFRKVAKAVQVVARFGTPCAAPVQGSS